MTEKSASRRLLQDHVFELSNLAPGDVVIAQAQLRVVGELLNQFETGELKGTYERAEESALRWSRSLQRQTASINRLLKDVETKDAELKAMTADRDAAAEFLRLAHELQDRQAKEVVAIGDECETLKLEMGEKKVLIAKLTNAVGATKADLVAENERLAAELADSKLGEENLQRELADLKAGRAKD